MAYQKVKIRSWLAARLRRAGRVRGWLPSSLSGSLLGSLIGAEGNLALGMRDYELRPYPGNATLFIAMHEPNGEPSAEPGAEPGADADPAKVWAGKILGKCEIQKIPGTHSTMLSRPQVISLAHEITRRLPRSVRSDASDAVA
jgi:thioesterase domain-containing protein